MYMYFLFRDIIRRGFVMTTANSGGCLFFTLWFLIRTIATISCSLIFFFRILIFLLNISMYNKRGYIIATTFLLPFFSQVYWCLQVHCTICSPKLLQPCILLWWPILPHPWSPSAAVRLPLRPVLTCWPHSALSPLTGMFTRGRNWHPLSTVVSWNIAAL